MQLVDMVLSVVFRTRPCNCKAAQKAAQEPHLLAPQLAPSCRHNWTHNYYNTDNHVFLVPSRFARA